MIIICATDFQPVKFVFKLCVYTPCTVWFIYATPLNVNDLIEGSLKYLYVFTQIWLHKFGQIDRYSMNTKVNNAHNK